jgi:hypothetical protein
LAQLVTNFQSQVSAAGEHGCGYEAPLEAAYRFLSDPEPYESLVRVPCNLDSNVADCVERSGIDEDLLLQRSVFLRPDSVLGVVYLTDEDDCSFRPEGQGYMMTLNHQLPSATRACDDDPNSDCCVPCTAVPPSGCESDLDLNGCFDPPADADEARGLRCFDQKRRFGVNFLRSTEVYSAGFTRTMVADRSGNPRPNPLFTGGRKPEAVFLVGIVGVPWQDTATAATRDDPPNLELSSSANLDWSLFLRDGGEEPTDPFNVQSSSPRQGSHPLTGETLGGVGTWNGINGHEQNQMPNDGFGDSLQYSCIFPLSEPRDCSVGDVSDCDCVTDIVDSVEHDYADGNPVCLDPITQSYGAVQHYARATPAPRILEVLRGVSCPLSTADCNDRAVVSSICPRQASDRAAPDFGYRPAMRALLRGIAKTLSE